MKRKIAFPYSVTRLYDPTRQYTPTGKSFVTRNGDCNCMKRAFDFSYNYPSRQETFSRR